MALPIIPTLPRRGACLACFCLFCCAYAVYFPSFGTSARRPSLRIFHRPLRDDDNRRSRASRRAGWIAIARLERGKAFADALPNGDENNLDWTGQSPG